MAASEWEMEQIVYAQQLRVEFWLNKLLNKLHLVKG